MVKKKLSVWMLAIVALSCVIMPALAAENLSGGPRQNVNIEYVPSCVDGEQGGAVNQNCCQPGSVAVISDPTDPWPHADQLVEEVLNPDLK